MYERRLAAPAAVGRLGLALDTEFGFWASRTDGRTKPGSPPFFFEQETATELGSRFPFFCGFNDKGEAYCFLFIPISVAWTAGLTKWGYPSRLNPGRPLRKQERAPEHHL